MNELISKKKQIILKLEKIKDTKELYSIKSDIFGKKGFLTEEFKKLGGLSPDERKKIASELNKTKDELTNLLNSKDFFLRHKISIETKMIKNCDHNIPIEASSLALNFIKKNLII